MCKSSMWWPTAALPNRWDTILLAWTGSPSSFQKPSIWNLVGLNLQAVHRGKEYLLI